MKTTYFKFKLLLILAAIALLAVPGMLVVNMVSMPGKSYQGSFADLKGHEVEIESQLKEHVEKLGGKIGIRNNPITLQMSLNYITDRLKSSGYVVKEQKYAVDTMSLRNIEAEKKGSEKPEEIIILGAHYDTVNCSPGSDDNGSGVASVLELARLFADKNPKRTIRFVLFASEEPPYFRSHDMGSYHYAKKCKALKENIKGVLILETLGYYTEEPNSQTYPLSYLPGYPDKGNFITFVSNLNSQKLLKKCMSAFRSSTDFPSVGVSVPEWITGVDWSDQMYFWKNNIQAVMITDTALYRNPYYHEPTDAAETLNYPYFARVVGGLETVVAALANYD
jgi:Zn-dependent M28 family amino/carboxypeptidase